MPRGILTLAAGVLRGLEEQRWAGGSPMGSPSSGQGERTSSVREMAYLMRQLGSPPSPPSHPLLPQSTQQESTGGWLIEMAAYFCYSDSDR